jgi:hypothetical protein
MAILEVLIAGINPIMDYAFCLLTLKSSKKW